jgi:glyoxylase-like metal-dependent hydrolase (beta-lactamase superfamily II)
VAHSDEGESFCFSGDNLFLQSFGRPDLGGQGEAWAPLVYRAIFKTIPENLPEEGWVLPGHYARPDEARDDGRYASRLSEIWEFNRDLQISSREDFLQHVLAHLPEMPPQYVQIKRVNAGLVVPDEEQASELELGKNICALSTAY